LSGRRIKVGEHGKELSSEQVPAGRRTYFFDVKESKDGARYLVITESKKAGEARERNSVMVFEDDIVPFSKTLKKAVKVVIEQSL
jgi:hypothetical protein